MMQIIIINISIIIITIIITIIIIVIIINMLKRAHAPFLETLRLCRRGSWSNPKTQ